VSIARKTWLWLGVGALVAGIALWYGASSPGTPPAGASKPPVLSTAVAARRVTAGVRMPRVFSAADAESAADDEVIGVVVGGRARAYRVKNMAYLMNHVVNDMIDGRPVSVTYCDKTDCVLVLTDAHEAEPLAIDIGATSEGLFLFVGDEAYVQQTGLSPRNQQPLPFEEMPFERTTWGEWRRKHPDSAVFEGPGP
jgi:hypothetical protein